MNKIIFLFLQSICATKWIKVQYSAIRGLVNIYSELSRLQLYIYNLIKVFTYPTYARLIIIQ
jgi:hypothetical protein